MLPFRFKIKFKIIWKIKTVQIIWNISHCHVALYCILLWVKVYITCILSRFCYIFVWNFDKINQHISVLLLLFFYISNSRADLFWSLSRLLISCLMALELITLNYCLVYVKYHNLVVFNVPSSCQVCKYQPQKYHSTSSISAR